MASGAISEALLNVRHRVESVVKRFGRSDHSVRLVAVSKTKSVEAVMEAYNAGQRHFGENYVQEIISKAEFLPSDIKWHFIGHLQSNKCKSIIAIPNLFVVETVDSEKLASKLNSLCKESDRVLNVMVQVNTSAELSKSGVDPGKECVALAQFIHTNCKNLNLLGLMTIGSFSDEPSRECFDVLQKCRAEVASELNCAPETLELSMGMSNDFELAIECGSNNIRVGSTIFGARG